MVGAPLECMVIFLLEKMMAYVKKVDIEMLEQDGLFQLSVGNTCVTGYNYKTADDCYKAYIAELINSIEKTRATLTNNTGY